MDGAVLSYYSYSTSLKAKKYYQSARLLQLAFAFPFMSHYGIIGALLACSVILLYDGRRGIIRGKVAKYGFYAHLSCASDNFKTILTLSSTIFRTFAKFEFAFYV